jgi:hypothetical protein
MTTQDVSMLSRANLERAFAGLLFGGTVALVAIGSIAMALHAAFAG